MADDMNKPKNKPGNIPAPKGTPFSTPKPARADAPTGGQFAPTGGNKPAPKKAPVQAGGQFAPKQLKQPKPAPSPLEKLMGGLNKQAEKDLAVEKKNVAAIKNMDSNRDKIIKQGFAPKDFDHDKYMKDTADWGRKIKEAGDDPVKRKEAFDGYANYMDNLTKDLWGEKRSKELSYKNPNRDLDHKKSIEDQMMYNKINAMDNGSSMELTGDDDDEQVIVDRTPDGKYVLASASGNHIDGSEPDETYESKPLTFDELMSELEERGYDKYLYDKDNDPDVRKKIQEQGFGPKEENNDNPWPKTDKDAMNQALEFARDHFKGNNPKDFEDYVLGVYEQIMKDKKGIK